MRTPFNLFPVGVYPILPQFCFSFYFFSKSRMCFWTITRQIPLNHSVDNPLDQKTNYGSYRIEVGTNMKLAKSNILYKIESLHRSFENTFCSFTLSNKSTNPACKSYTLGRMLYAANLFNLILRFLSKQWHCYQRWWKY